jgi:hypothetical protein
VQDREEADCGVVRRLEKAGHSLVLQHVPRSPISCSVARKRLGLPARGRTHFFLDSAVRHIERAEGGMPATHDLLRENRVGEQGGS